MVKESRKGGLHDGQASFSPEILHAVSKVRAQKQRPNEERICSVIRQKFKGMKDKEILAHLEKAVEDGILLRTMSKGQTSYRDPKSTSLQPRVLHITQHMDLKKVIIRAIKDLNERGGSSLRQIEKYISQGYSLKTVGSAVLADELKANAKEVVEEGHLIQEGNVYKLCSTQYDADSAASTCGEEAFSPIIDKAVKADKVSKVDSIFLVD